MLRAAISPWTGRGLHGGRSRDDRRRHHHRATGSAPSSSAPSAPGPPARRGRTVWRDRVLVEHADARDGVRMALGAERGDVLRLVMRQGGRLALVGIGAGVVLAALVGRVLGSYLLRRERARPHRLRGGGGDPAGRRGSRRFVPALSAARLDRCAHCDGIDPAAATGRAISARPGPGRSAAPPRWPLAMARTVSPAARAASAVVGPMTAAGTPRRPRPRSGERLHRRRRREDGDVHPAPQRLGQRLPSVRRDGAIGHDASTTAPPRASPRETVSAARPRRAGGRAGRSPRGVEGRDQAGGTEIPAGSTDTRAPGQAACTASVVAGPTEARLSPVGRPTRGRPCAWRPPPRRSRS